MRGSTIPTRTTDTRSTCDNDANEPGSPWQRDTNENTNGLLRQYFPKGTDLAVDDAHTLRAIEERLNNRPRKTLGWKAPTDLFTSALTR
jgi:IS30 family transposase